MNMNNSILLLCKQERGAPEFFFIHILIFGNIFTYFR